jgi:DNA-binding GntR family transcriptional regulator
MALPARDTEISVVDQVITTLRDRIIAADLAPGQRLVEADLTSRLGVSRGTLREAMRRLLAEGLLDAQHNRGFSVRRLTKKDLLDLLAIHEALACMAARLAAQNAADLVRRKQLALRWKMMAAPVKTGRLMDYLEHYPRFHDLVVDLSGNSYLIEQQRRLILYTFRKQFFLLIDQRTMEQWHRENSQILQAIEAFDGGKAHKAMAAHVSQFAKRVEQADDGLFA